MKKWYDIGIQYSLYALVIIVPIIFSPLFYTVFSAPKLLALRILTLLIMVFWGAKVFVEEEFSCKRGWLNILLLIYAIVSILSTIFSIAFFTSLFGTAGRFLGIFTIFNLLLLPLFIWNFLVKKKEVLILLKISLITASILAIYGIFQFFGLFQEGFNWNQVPSDKIFGTIGHGNHFGAYLGMHILFGACLIPTIKEKWIKALLILAIIIQIATLFLTASRGALIAVIIASVVALIILCIKKWDDVKSAMVKLLLPVFLLVSIIASTVIILGNDLKEVPLVSKTIQTVSYVQEGNIPDRYSWWLSSIEMIKDRPLLGYGVSTFRDVYNQYRRTDYRTYEAGGMEDHITPEAAHNEYLNIAATQGVLGLAAFLLIVLFAFAQLRKNIWEKGKNDEQFYISLGLKSALLVYLLQIIISFGVISTLTIFYVFIGCAVAFGERKSSVKTTKVKGVKKYILIILILSGISIAFLGTLSEALAEIHYKNGLTEATYGNTEKAIEEFEMMINVHPFQYEYLQVYGDTIVKLSKASSVTQQLKIELLGMAILNYENALIINDLHPSTYYNLGIATMQLSILNENDFLYNNAEYNFNNAIQKAVNNPLYPYQVGKAYMALGSDEATQKAINYFEQAQKIRSPFKNTEEILIQLRGIESEK